jgi:hypothetical protein
VSSKVQSLHNALTALIVIVWIDIKRAESMKVELKKPKRTPSFTTRRRTQSFRKLQRLEQLDQLPPVEIQGTLDRKHELQSAGKKAPVRSWKTFYTGEEQVCTLHILHLHSLTHFMVQDII